MLVHGLYVEDRQVRIQISDLGEHRTQHGPWIPGGPDEESHSEQCRLVILRYGYVHAGQGSFSHVAVLAVLDDPDDLSPDGSVAQPAAHGVLTGPEAARHRLIDHSH